MGWWYIQWLSLGLEVVGTDKPHGGSIVFLRKKITMKKGASHFRYHQDSSGSHSSISQTMDSKTIWYFQLTTTCNIQFNIILQIELMHWLTWL